MAHDNDSENSSENFSSPNPPQDPLVAEAFGQNRKFKLNIPTGAKAAALVALFILASVGYLSGHFAKAPSNANSQLGGAPEVDPQELAKRQILKNFILTDAEGKQKKLSDFRGNVVILSFWASWCTPCLLELPTFGEIEKKLHDRGLRVIAVNVDEGDTGKNFAKEFWAKHGFTFPTFFDTDKSLSQEFDIDALPSNFVIDRKGRLVFGGFGATDWNDSQTADFIEGLLQESDQEPVLPAQNAKGS